MDSSSVTTLSSEIPTYPLAISLFGSFQATLQGKPLTDFRSNKGRALLAYLVMAKQKPVARTTLTNLLWQNYQPNSARTNLRQVLSNLREILAPLDLIKSNYQTVQLTLDPAVVWCDVLAFDELIDACQRHTHATLAHCPLCQTRLQEAAALYKGAFLENFGEIDSTSFQEWRRSQRAHYAARFVDLQAAQHTSGQRQGNLPRSLTSLLGREPELQELAQKLLHPIYRCLTLIGPGGIGKSRLAIALGEQMQMTFMHGVWFVPLAAVPPEREETGESTYLLDRIATTISTSLGLQLHGAQHPTQQLTAYLRDKTLLLILDNFEHLSEGVDLLVTLLQEAPNVRIVVTSRHRLRFQAQLVYQVSGLPLPFENAEETLSATEFIATYASLQLFVERAENALLPFAYTTTNLAAVGALCRLLEGAPLGIELAVALLEKQSPPAILQAVRTHYTTLQANLGDLPQRQRSAEAVLRTAWTLLKPQEAQTLACCAVFRGGFTQAAAQQIVGATPADLEALLNKSLLHLTDDGRYTIHELVRQFADEQLAAQPALARTMHERHMRHYLALLAGWQTETAMLAFRQAIQQDLANVEAAWAWALTATQVTALLAALPGLQYFYRLVCRFHQGEGMLLQASSQVRAWLAVAPPDIPAAQRQLLPQLLIQLLLKLCEIYNHYLPQPTQVLVLVQEIIEQSTRLGRADLVAEGYAEWSLTLFTLGNFAEQKQLLEKALPLAQAQEALLPQIKSLLSFGMNAQGFYDFATALTTHQRALTLAEAYHDPLLALRIRNHVAMVYRDTGDLEKALAYFQQNLQIAQQLEQVNEMAYATANFGLVNLLLGNFAQAQIYLEEALQVFSEQGEYRLVAEHWSVMGMLFQQSQNSEKAIACCQQALVLAAPHQYYHAQRAAWEIAGKAYLQLGDIEQAEAMFQQLISYLEGTDNALELFYGQAGLASVRLAQQDIPAALALIEDVLLHLNQERSEMVDHPELYLICYQVLAAAQDERAVKVLQQGWQLVQSQAAKISEPRLHASFLNNVPANRDLGAFIAALGER